MKNKKLLQSMKAVWLASALFLTVPVSAQIYVSEAGSDTETADGTWDNPYKTIDYAFNKATAGVSIRLLKGETYPRAESLPTSTANMKLEGGYTADGVRDIDPANTIITGASRFFAGGGNGIYVSGVTITGINGRYYGAIIQPTGVITFEDCIFKDNENTMENTGGGMIRPNGSSVSTITLRRCIFEYNRMSNAARGEGSAVVFNNSSTLLAEDCIFRNNVSSLRGVISISAGTPTATLYNCIFHDNQSAAISMGTGTVNAYNCLFAGNTKANTVTGSSTTQNCIFYNNAIPTIGTLTTNAEVDANSFVDAAAKNWLPVHNPAVANKGTAVSGLTTDLLGNARVQDGTIDIGPYESSGLIGSITNSHTAVTSVTVNGKEITVADGDYSGGVYGYFGDVVAITFLAAGGNAACAADDNAIQLTGAAPFYTATITVNEKIDVVALSGDTPPEYTVTVVLPESVSHFTTEAGETNPYPVVGGGSFTATFHYDKTGYHPVTDIGTITGTYPDYELSIQSITEVNTTVTISDEADYVDPDLLDLEITNLVMSKVRADKLTREKATIDATADLYLSKMNANGSFSDLNVTTNAEYLARLKELAIAYSQSDSKYYENEDVYNKIVLGLHFWLNNWTNHSNWWYDAIGRPRELGLTFVALYFGKKDFLTTQNTLFRNLKAKWLEKGYARPDAGGAQTAGANKVDIATNWLYICGFERNKPDFEYAVNEGFKVAAFTIGEGIQNDYSFRQHGAQLYIGGYGTELAQLTVRMAYYLSGTGYALSGDKLDVVAGFVRDTYIPVIRGQRMSFNAMGRQLTRPNYTGRTSDASFIEMLKEIDPGNVQVYDDAVQRINGSVDASTGLDAFQRHYYRGEYTLHQRPEYTFDIRMVSNRMARSEYDASEAQLAFFRAEGATSVMITGEEYGGIVPVLDWTKIPGTTLPAFTLDATRQSTTFPRANSYIHNGRSDYAGGVTDGLYGVTAFDMFNDEELYAYNDNNKSKGLLPALHFGAKKSWFVFDKEIVCLGAGIYSGHDLNVYTTLNQCRKDGDVVVSNGETETILNIGTETYANPKWILNDKIAYYFPSGGTVSVSNESRSSSAVFTACIDHGKQPTDAKYAYVIVPNIASASEAAGYPIDHIEILSNSDSIQAVFHKELKLYGLAFFKPGYFKANGLEVEVDAGCVLLIKDADQAEVTVLVADPQKKGAAINIGIGASKLSGMKSLSCPFVASPHTGKTLEFKVNETNPEYKGRRVFTLLDREGWTITCSLNGPTDGTVGGDDPYYIIDGDDITSFLFVKPGKSYGGITAPSDYIPAFTIDMQSEQEFNSFVYRHRTQGNTAEILRANKVSLYGKNSGNDEFTPLIQQVSIPTDVAEVTIPLPENVNYRYVKLTMDAWNTSSGSTIQTSEFNLALSSWVTGRETEIGIQKMVSNHGLSVYPNPVNRGDLVKVTVPNEGAYTIVLTDLLGRVALESKLPEVDTRLLSSGMYLVLLKNDLSKKIEGSTKLIVK